MGGVASGSLKIPACHSSIPDWPLLAAYSYAVTSVFLDLEPVPGMQSPDQVHVGAAHSSAAVRALGQGDGTTRLMQAE